jgi:hypothetical protein
MAIERIETPQGDYFKDQETGAEYCRIVGGLAWPFGKEPGFLVVVGEDFVKTPGIGRSLYVLAEREGPYLDDLIRYWQELRGQYLADPWIGDPSFKGNINFFHTAGERDRQGFTLLEAPYFDDPHGLSSYFQLIRSLLKSTHKVLHFVEGSILPGYLQALPPEEMMKPAPEHPPVAALGYAVAYLFFNSADGRMTPDDVDDLIHRYGRRG